MMDGLSKSLAGDLDRAFPGVVDAMGARLYWGLRRMSGSHHEAEDLTQETLIRAYQALSGYDPGRISDLNLEPWLWTIALNLGRNHLRDRARRPTPVVLEDTVTLSDPDPVDTRAWDRRMAGLSGPQRTAVVLRHVVGLGIDEICEVTGRPAGTVKADIHRGLSRLKKILEDEK